MPLIKKTTVLLRDINHDIKGKVNGIFFYKDKKVNKAILDYAQKFDNWKDLYFKDLSLTKSKAKIFVTEIEKSISTSKKLVKTEIYEKVK